MLDVGLHEVIDSQQPDVEGADDDGEDAVDADLAAAVDEIDMDDVPEEDDGPDQELQASRNRATAMLANMEAAAQSFAVLKMMCLVTSPATSQVRRRMDVEQSTA